MKVKLLVVLIILCLLISAGCDSQSVATYVPLFTAEPTLTPSPIPTATIYLTSTPSPTLAPKQATETAVNIYLAKEMQTQAYFMFTEVPATLAARDAKCKDGFSLEDWEDVITASNDTWTLFTCSPFVPSNVDLRTPGLVDFGTRYTEIIRTNLSKTWIIPHSKFHFFASDSDNAAMGAYRWTKDGEYLYLYPYYFFGPDGGPNSWFLYSGIDSLYRINLETGNFEVVLSHDQFNAFALSPNDQLLVYSEKDRPDIIHIRNMETGGESRVKVNESIIAAGAFIWNLDSTKVVFSVGYAKQGKDWQDDLADTSIFVLTPKSMYIQKVLANDPRLFMPYECSGNSYWLDENTICLYSTNDQLDSWNEFFSFNIQTGQVIFLRHW